MRKNNPDPGYFLDKPIPTLQDYTVVERIGTGNNGHVFRAHSDKANHDIACKVISVENLLGKEQEPPAWRQEIDKANILESPIAVKFLHVGEWKAPEANIDCAVLCASLIKGESLKKYKEKNRKRLSVVFIEDFFKRMLSLIHDMKQNNVQHGDLHLGNILVEDRRGQLGGPDYDFRVTDFGVASVSGAHFKDDFDQLAINLRELLEVAEINYQEMSPRDKFAFNMLNDYFLGRYLLETDTTREPLARDTRALFHFLEGVDDKFTQEQQARLSEAHLITPFDYLNCEQIGESHGLLHALYSNAFLGLKEIESRNNLVLTGPRGCGKSTVFKSLSLQHRFLAGGDNLDAINYIGIYYRCDDLYSAFPRYKLPAREEALDIPMHFLIVSLIRLMLTTIEMWGSRYFQDEFSRREKSISERLWKILGIKRPNTLGADSFKGICSQLENERHRAHRKQRVAHVKSEKFGEYFGPDALIKVCDFLKSHLVFLRGKPFYFFIDDYSMPKVSFDLQRNLNRLLMQRTACAFFKLSTESPVSYIREDVDGKAYVEGREFLLENLGLKYLYAKPQEIIQFIEDVFKRRFDAVPNFPVKNLEELIGDFKPPTYNEIALSIREGEKSEMWGKQILCELCSGDIFYIISLVGKMTSEVEDYNTLAAISAEQKIAPSIQGKTIRKEAGDFLSNLRRIQDGGKLVDVVTAFGSVANSYLKYKNSRNEANNPPFLASRIEPFEELSLSEEAKKIYHDLLRYSLFIEDPRGKSLRGRVVPRLYLRRALLPHFNLTFSKRDAISLENHEIEVLLREPKRFERHKKFTKENEMHRKIKKQEQEEEKQGVLPFDGEK